MLTVPYSVPDTIAEELHVPGLPMTYDLNSTVIVQDRKERAANSYHDRRPFLARRHIPTVIRAQIIRSVLVPIGRRGCEL